MGILDDAIRDHLELIRRRGATDSEVRRLEDEAFGPPTRPDEADFPGSEEGPSSGNGAAHEDVTTLLPADERDEPAAEPTGTGLEEPTGAHVTGDVDTSEGEPVPGGPVEEAQGQEPVAEEHAIVEEPPVDAAEEVPADAGPVSDQEATMLYDQDHEEGVDPSLDVAPEGEAPSEEHPAAEPEGTTPLEPPVESLDTVEHSFPDEIVEEHEEAPASDEHAVPEDAPPQPEDEQGAEASDEGDDDVLADTPDFLKDQPEDDELWFEQREPKDFDF